MGSDLTCIITGHREGRLCVPSLRSFQAGIDTARAAGLAVQALFVLDRPDALTERLFDRARAAAGAATEDLLVVDFGDQGQARNTAIDRAEGRLTAFLDADDLWSRDWPLKGVQFLADRPDTHIAHPEFNYFFEQQATIYRHVDQEAEDFDIDLLRVANYWDALCVCPTRIYRDFPFCARDIAGGWAYEDWYWNCETVAAGMIHKIVPDTLLFKRRQKSSQTMRASRNQSRVRPNPLSRYDHPVYAATGDAAGAG